MSNTQLETLAPVAQMTYTETTTHGEMMYMLSAINHEVKGLLNNE